MIARTVLFAAALLPAVLAAELAVADELKRFADAEITIIREYFDDRDPLPGKAKGRKSLPPGIAKNLRRGKPLPPGIARRGLPADLLAQLPPPPRGYERVVVDGRVLLVEIATRVVHDILSDVFID